MISYLWKLYLIKRLKKVTRKLEAATTWYEASSPHEITNTWRARLLSDMKMWQRKQDRLNRWLA